MNRSPSRRTKESRSRLLAALLLPTLLGGAGWWALRDAGAAFGLYAVGGCVLAPWVLLRARPLQSGRGLPFPPPQAGWPRADAGLVVLFGPVFLAIYLFVRPWLGDVAEYQARLAALGVDLGAPLLAGILFVVLNPLLEEWWWRGQATPRCCAAFGRRRGLALATAGFGLYHVVMLAALFPLPLALVWAGLITGAGWWWSELALRRGSWRTVYAAHLAADLAMAVLFVLVVMPG